MTNQKFNIGDKVVALGTSDDHPAFQPIIKGKTYIVQSVFYCCWCGIQALNVTNTLSRKHVQYFNCTCGEEIPMVDSCLYSASKFFAKVDDIDKELEKAIESEDYETAVVLRDIKLSM